MTNLKLGVEVVSAHDLMPKDGQGAASFFVELHFDNQIARTTTKEKEVNPVWDEIFYFNISDPHNLSNLTLSAYVYHRNGKPNSKSFLGKVCLPGTLFVPYSDPVVMQSYPLQKRGILDPAVRGELGLKVFATNHYLPASNPNLEHQQDIPPAVTQPSANKLKDMKSAPKAPKTNHRSSSSSYSKSEHMLKETEPCLSGGKIVEGRFVRGERQIHTSSYDLVETMDYLFVRVVKALHLTLGDIRGSLDPYVELNVGKYKAFTKHFEEKQNPEWNDVFTIARNDLQYSLVLDVVVKGKDLPEDDFVGSVKFNLHEVPTRVPPDTPLDPKWYQLSPKDGEQKRKGELMLAVWYGTQADEAFPNSWHSDAVLPADASPDATAHIRSQVYQSPTLWYVRVNVIEAQDLVVSNQIRLPNVYAKIQIGDHCLETQKVELGTMNPIWNEELMFVAAEPFDDDLILSVEDHVSPDRDEQLGKLAIALNSVERRVDDRTISSKWFNLKSSISDTVEGDQPNVQRNEFSSRIHLCVFLEGGYHVPDESTDHSIYLPPAAKELWKPCIGVIELGILGVVNLIPTKTRKGKGTSDPYCVAKYGHKWIRTRTITDSLNPRYNEHHSWEVHDLSTFLTVGVFDNSRISNSNGNREVELGKIRIRLSNLEMGRVYTHYYPLLSLGHSGTKKTGDLHLAIRVSCTSFVNMMFEYSQPLMPNMHFTKPLSVVGQDKLLKTAVSMVAGRLGQAVPPLSNEVVYYMSDTANNPIWSLRRSKANFFRLMSGIGVLLSVGKWFGEICAWKNPITTMLVHVLFVMLVCTPELIMPTIFLYMCVKGAWNFQYRPRYPPHINIRVSYLDSTHPDELDEEFDEFPTSQPSDIIRMRYDRLRSVAGRLQTLSGDIVMNGERIHLLLSWRDPRATSLFTAFCLVAAIVLWVTPFKALVVLTGIFLMRHPWLRRGKMPSVPFNFLTRLPSNGEYDV